MSGCDADPASAFVDDAEAARRLPRKVRSWRGKQWIWYAPRITLHLSRCHGFRISSSAGAADQPSQDIGSSASVAWAAACHERAEFALVLDKDRRWIDSERAGMAICKDGCRWIRNAPIADV